MDLDNSYVKIRLDALEHNLRAVAEKTGRQVMAVVKADAYGHGAVQVARALEPSCAFFGVSSPAEALELRQTGVKKPILLLGHTQSSAFEAIVRHDLRVAMFHPEEAELLSLEAQRQGKTARIHIAVDTGMSRIGVKCNEEGVRQALKMAALPGIEAEGLFSHYATADCADLSAAQNQARRFAWFDQQLRSRGLSVPVRHLDNSAGAMNFQDPYEMVRAGIVLYGLYPSQEVDPQLLPLIPALSWHSRVSHLQVLEPGTPIGYGGTHVTDKVTRVATVPVGYADGYRWSLSGKFHVLLRGQKAPILGRVCMDQMMVDVTHIPGVSLGDTVTLLGTDGTQTITAQDISAAAGSFPYEFVCGISRRVTRRYYRGDTEVHTVRHLLHED